MEEEEGFYLACEDELGEDMEAEWNPEQEDSILCSQCDQTRDCGDEEEEEEEGEENEDRNARRDAKLLKRKHRINNETITRERERGLSFGSASDNEEEQKEQESEEYKLREEAYRKTSAMMLRTATEEGEEEEEEEENERGKQGTNRRTQRKKRGNNGIMGLDDDVQLDFSEMCQEMLKKERDEPRKVLWESGLGWLRAKLIDWVSQMAEKGYLGLCDRTTHLCVAILDEVASGFATQESLCLAALACLLLASKHEEVEEKVPTLHELIVATGSRFTESLIIRMEALVLTKIGWQLMRVTSVLFLHNFVRRGACRLDMDSDRFDAKQLQLGQIEPLEGYINKYASFFCDVCLQDMELSNEKHSLLAAASLACARRALKVSPHWTDSLRDITTYDANALASCVSKIWTLYSQSFNSSVAAP